MKRGNRWLFNSLVIFGLTLIFLASCSPQATPIQAPEQESQPTRAPAAVEKPAETSPLPAPSATPARAAAPQAPELVEGRLVELEWPAQLRMGESDVIRLALVPTHEGYVARAEFPDHDLQTKEVPIPRPNGYELYAIARLDGIGFDISPTGDLERFLPQGEEIAWRWTLSPRAPGQQALSVQLRLRWVPAPGVSGSVRESLAYGRGLDVRVVSFLGMSRAQAASTGMVGLMLGAGFLLFAAAGPLLTGRRAASSIVTSGGRAAVRVVVPPAETDSTPVIDAPGVLSLSSEESGLLRALFQKYARLVIENEFFSGYSGARTFLVSPLRSDGCADARTIVKLGPRVSIAQEFANYETFVKDRLPPVTARIQQPPVVLSNTVKSIQQRAAMQYTFIAEPGRAPVSLRRALLDTPDPSLLYRLFETFGPSWWMQRRAFTFRLGQEYDALLPPHFVCEPVWEVRSRNAPVILTETTDPARITLAAGSMVAVTPFRRMDLRADGKSLSLVGASQEGRSALRLRWLSARPPHPQAPTAARVVATRTDLLRAWTDRFDRFGADDPLDLLPDLLETPVAGTRSVIHGDLNLENVLVGPGSLVWLIDFAQTREGHPLHDFAHLESELIAHVLAVRAGSPRAYFDMWRAGDDPLLAAMHAIAGRCLFDPARPREYHLTLFMACLGALKYQNLSDLSKHCLYLTAADLVEKVLS